MSDSSSDSSPQDLRVELDPETAEGTYANLTMISHSPEEFFLDFARIVPGSGKARLKSRVILTPAHAKRLLRALEENIEHYEETHGAIERQGRPRRPSQYFGGIGGEA